MAAPAKIVQTLVLLAKEESTPGTKVALTGAADAIQAQFQDKNIPWPSPEYAFDGDLGPAIGSLGKVQRAAKGGQSVGFDFPTVAKGAGAAYSASAVPSFHRLLKAAGFDATVDTTPGSESWTYDPSGLGPTAFTTLSAELYGRSKGATASEKLDLVYVVADWGFTFDDPGVPIHTFRLRGYLNSAIADSDLPAGLAYPLTSVVAPLATGMTFALGSLSAEAKVKGGSFALNRDIEHPRISLSSSGGVEGFTPGLRAPELKVVLERTALVVTPFTSGSAFDPYQLEQTGQVVAASVQFGSTQYNRWKLSLPQAQVIGIQDQVVEGIGCVELTIQPHVSSPTASDDVQVVTD